MIENGLLVTDTVWVCVCFNSDKGSYSIYCKSTIYFPRHNNIMVYLLNFNITHIIILATCFDSYESVNPVKPTTPAGRRRHYKGTEVHP